MIKLKIPLKDINGKQIYDGDLVKIDDLIYKCKFCDIKNKQFWFLKDGVGWIFHLDKYKIEKVN